MKMKVWRMENKWRQGPYKYTREGKKDELFGGEMMSVHDHPIGRKATRPVLWTDGIKLPDEQFHKWRSGFSTLKKARWWFHGHIQRLRSLGFEIKCYEVPTSEVIKSKSGKQLVFSEKYHTKEHEISS